jgi:hypothetical protein
MTRIALGTEKGAYFLEESNGTWTVSGPVFPGWKVTAFTPTPGGEYLAAVASNWFGAGIHRSGDLITWEPIDNPPSWDESSGRKMEQLWRFHVEGRRIWAGVAHAGLFYSEDDGYEWQGVDGLNEHETRDDWEPGLGGLAAHRILTSGRRAWVAISAVGVFRSDDEGGTWAPKNDGVPPASAPQDASRPAVGYCVHGLAQDPDNPGQIWRQDHRGVFRTSNGAEDWERIEDGLPAGFGFVMWRDEGSGRLFTIPLESDQNRVPVDGRLRAYKSDDGGDTWKVSGSGWPTAPQFTGVLRGAFDGDNAGTSCFGTTGGQLWLTRDNGEAWKPLDPIFPRIGAVSIL